MAETPQPPPTRKRSASASPIRLQPGRVKCLECCHKEEGRFTKEAQSGNHGRNTSTPTNKKEERFSESCPASAGTREVPGMLPQRGRAFHKGSAEWKLWPKHLNPHQQERGALQRVLSGFSRDA